MMSENLLVELLVEELPPKSLKQLGSSFAGLLFTHLKSQDLTTQDSQVTSYASPRRLAVHITNVVSQAADRSVVQKLMPVTVGLNANGEATPPLLKKLAGLGADASVVSKLKRAMDGKTETLFFDITLKGTTLSEGLQLALQETVRQLPIPKVMTYPLADGWQSVNFVRPAHGLIALHGSNVVAVDILGLHAQRQTQGHRFEAKINPITVRTADSYAQQLLEEGAVIAGFAERQKEIVHQMEAAASYENFIPIEDTALLDEVTALVEHPNVLVGTFDPSFLQVPQECLILTMKANQKYFPMLDATGTLANKFLLVANIKPTDSTLIVTGNERVVRSRLADAQFFFNQDRKKTLESRLPQLNKVVYHNKLGTQGLRMEYVRAVAIKIAEQLAGQSNKDDLGAQIGKAARLAKADLMTDMVGEFPELQGIMGRYYAQQEGLNNEIAFAIEDHYKPRFAGDALPRNEVGICVALADKLVTLLDMFSIGELPTGDKDPFALRRHALGVIRILLEKNLIIGMNTLIQCAIDVIEDKHIALQWAQNATSSNQQEIKISQRSITQQAQEQLLTFISDRLSGYLREQYRYTPQEVDAVLTLNSQDLSDILERLKAVRNFVALPDAVHLAAANKRVGNILKKAESEGFNRETSMSIAEVGNQLRSNSQASDAERELFNALVAVSDKTDSVFRNRDYETFLKTQAVLKVPIDNFFDHVMVNVEDKEVRERRLRLLLELQSVMNKVADLSKLAT